MGWFKRLCLFVFGLAVLLSLVALSLTWVGPWTPQFRSWLELRWFFVTLEVLVCIAALGSLACVIAALFAPRNPRETIVAQVSGGKITVTRAAITSQTRHVIEADGSCVASSVKVKVRKRGHVRVSARVTPVQPVDVVAHGEKLYAELQEGLARVCGDNVKSINVVFTEPRQPDAPFVQDEDGEADSQTSSASSEEASITVPMGHTTHSDLALVDEPSIEESSPEHEQSQVETLVLRDTDGELGAALDAEEETAQMPFDAADNQSEEV